MPTYTKTTSISHVYDAAGRLLHTDEVITEVESAPNPPTTNPAYGHQWMIGDVAPCASTTYIKPPNVYDINTHKGHSVVNF